MGRKPKYNTHVAPYLSNIGRWKTQGLTDEQIADNLGIAASTFQQYKADNEELKNILLIGDRGAADTLYNVIYEQAKGYYKKEIKKRTNKDGEIIYVEETEKWIPPDYRYLVLWLINHDKYFRQLSQEQREHEQQELEIKKQKAADNW